MAPDDFLISKEDIISSKEKEKTDLTEVHILRGRFIHWISIIEKIMKDYCDIEKATFGKLKYDFICKLKEDKKIKKDLDFDNFVKALIEINPDRNFWAHGFVFYKPRKDSNKTNNYISLNDEIKSIIPPYFDNISQLFTTIISWLEQNNLYKIDSYNISKFKV